jgi:hypothetical protein
MNVDTQEFAALRERVDVCADILLKAYLAEGLTPPHGLGDVNAEAAKYQGAAVASRRAPRRGLRLVRGDDR